MPGGAVCTREAESPQCLVVQCTREAELPAVPGSVVCTREAEFPPVPGTAQVLHSKAQVSHCLANIDLRTA